MVVHNRTQKNNYYVAALYLYRTVLDCSCSLYRFLCICVIHYTVLPNTDQPWLWPGVFGVGMGMAQWPGAGEPGLLRKDREEPWQCWEDDVTL